MEATINNLVHREYLSHSRMIFEIEATCCELGLERNKIKKLSLPNIRFRF